MKKQFCRRGHDRTLPGALWGKACIACARMIRAKYLETPQGQKAVERYRAKAREKWESGKTDSASERPAKVA